MNIAIIGGGFTGLTAAYELTKAGHSVTVFEKEKTLGGLAVGLKQPDWEWSLEKGYHHLFTNDKHIIGLLGDLGIADKIIIKRPVTANFTNGKIIQFDRPHDLFSYSDFSLSDKARTAALLAFLKINPFWKPLESLTSKQLLETIGGSNAWKKLWEPLLIGKFGNLAGSIAASWMWARINKRTPSLVYIAGGFQTLVDALEKEIKNHGGIISTGVTVDKIETSESGFRVKSTGSKSFNPIGKLLQKSEQFDRILLSAPTPIIVKLFPALTQTIKPSLAIPHLHAQTLILETKEPILQKAYWISILDRSFPFLAVVAHTNFMDKEHYGGHHLTYFGNYLPTGHKYLNMTKEQLLVEFLPFIEKIMASQGLSVKRLAVSRSGSLPFTLHASYTFVGLFAQPVHQLHYSRVAPPLKTTIPGLCIANLDSVYPWDRGTNYAVELGKKAARILTE